VVNVVETTLVLCLEAQISPYVAICGCTGFLGNGTCCAIWSSNYGSLFVTCFRGWISIAIASDLCTSSWSYYCLRMTYDANISSIEIVPYISFFLLIIKGLSSSSSSFESSTLLWSSIYNCLSDLLDNARGHLVFWCQPLNFNVFTLDVEAFYARASATSSGIYCFVYRKKCCIKILMTNVEWQTSFLRSTFTIPLNIFVLKVVNIFNFLYNCLNRGSAQYIIFPFIVVMMDMAFMLLK
jgi:hypothetical protein